MDLEKHGKKRRWRVHRIRNEDDAKEGSVPKKGKGIKVPILQSEVCSWM